MGISVFSRFTLATTTAGLRVVEVQGDSDFGTAWQALGLAGTRVLHSAVISPSVAIPLLVACAPVSRGSVLLATRPDATGTDYWYSAGDDWFGVRLVGSSVHVCHVISGEFKRHLFWAVASSFDEYYSFNTEFSAIYSKLYDLIGGSADWEHLSPTILSLWAA